MYAYAKRDPERGYAEHYGHIWEVWHAYVCDISQAPEWVGPDSSGLCCHTCETIIVDSADTDH